MEDGVLEMDAANEMLGDGVFKFVEGGVEEDKS